MWSTIMIWFNSEVTRAYPEDLGGFLDTDKCLAHPSSLRFWGLLSEESAEVNGRSFYDWVKQIVTGNLLEHYITITTHVIRQNVNEYTFYFLVRFFLFTSTAFYEFPLKIHVVCSVAVADLVLRILKSLIRDNKEMISI